MTVVDFIDVIDDIVDLSSDEETVQQDDIATQPLATLLDRQVVFVLGGEGRQDVQAAFVSGGEGSQVATESENALVATVSHLVTEKEPLHAAESQNCPSSPAAPCSNLTSTTPKVFSSEVGDTKQAAFVSAGEGNQEATESGNALVPTVSPWVMEKVPHDTSESKNSPSSPASTPLPSPACTTPKDLSSEDGDTQLVATMPPSGMEKAPLDTAETKSCPSSPASAPLLESYTLVYARKKRHAAGYASTTPKALTSEDDDTQLVATVSPLGMEKAPLDTAESKNYPSSPASAALLSPVSTTPKALTSEDGDTKPVRGPRLLECCTITVEELAADHKRPRMLEPAEESALPTDNSESTKTCSTNSIN